MIESVAIRRRRLARGTFSIVGPAAYTYVLKLHGKKSVHIVDTDQTPFGGGNAWRRAAFDGLVGRHDHARALLRALDAAPQVGLVAPAGQLYDQIEWKCATADLVATVLARLGIDRPVRGRFPAGTMFCALRRWRDSLRSPTRCSTSSVKRDRSTARRTMPTNGYSRWWSSTDGYRVTDSSARLG